MIKKIQTAINAINSTSAEFAYYAKIVVNSGIAYIELWREYKNKNRYHPASVVAQMSSADLDSLDVARWASETIRGYIENDRKQLLDKASNLHSQASKIASEIKTYEAALATIE